MLIFRVYQFSDEEEDTKREVRSAKDKRYLNLFHLILPSSFTNDFLKNDICDQYTYILV